VDGALASLQVPIAELENPRGFVEWAHFAHAMEAIQDLAGGPEGIADLSRAMDAPAALGSIGRLFRFAVTPRQLYQVAARTGARAFPALETRFDLLPGERIALELTIKQNERDCAAYFHGCVGFLEVAPHLLGLPNALVEAEIDARHGRFVITPPPSPSLPVRLKRIFQLYRASESTIDELNELHESLTYQSQQLTRARGELEDSERRFGEVFHLSPVPMVVSPIAGDRLIDANDAFMRSVGLEWEQLASTPIDELPLWPPDSDPAKIRAGLRALTPVRDIEIQFLDRSGALRHGLLSASSSHFEDQPVLLIQVVDVTESHEREQRERQSQKMEIVGQLAGGVAHDFNNLLTVISGRAEQQLESLEPRSEGHDAAHEIFQAADRAAKLTGQLLAFARRQILHPKRIDLNGTIRGLLEMLGRLIGEDILMQTDLDGGLPPILADSGQVEQVLLNLALNARDAMPTGGELRISTCSATHDEVGGAEGAERRNVEYVALSVGDTGGGIDPEIRPRIFEPFFTTKSADQGTGLGLATVHGIVMQSGGRLQVESQPGAGTTMTVFLPAAEGIEGGPPKIRATQAAPGSGRTVLLVEDEEAVRRLLRRQLEEADYSVLEAANGLEAVEVAASHAGPIHGLLTDMVMPGMGGVELEQELARRRPGIRTLFVSGYPLEQPRDGRTAVLSKPFRPAELLATLDSILSADDAD
jgi:PAS domain S-box-containing protein